MNIVVFQNNHLDSSSQLFLKLCNKVEKNSIVIFGEFVLTPFLNAPLKQILDSGQRALTDLQKISHDLNLTFIAPMILDSSFLDSKSKQKPLKTIALIKANETKIYLQNKLISYDHWNEKALFKTNKLDSNLESKGELKLDSGIKLCKKNDVFVFQDSGLKCAIVAGFEIHFDEIWIKLKKMGVDVVFMPTSCAFESNERWRALCRARSFNNGCLIVRANKAGNEMINDEKWNFYGDSLISMPNGEIIANLRNGEEILSYEISKKDIKEMADFYKFRAKL